MRRTRSLSLALAVALALAGGCGADIGNSGTADGGPPDAAPRSDAAVGPADAAPPDALPACVDGDAQVQDATSGACYMYFTTPLTHDAAETACGQLGAHLAVITSLDENTFFSAIAPSAVDSDIWIGGSDAITEGTWLWINGEPWVFDHWRTGEPNNGGDSGIPENCNIIEGDNNIAGEGCLWDDRACDKVYPYICERD